ncbi:MAG TPA: hypothetical protein VF512_01030 [Actinomycetota bacterium]
MGGTVTAQGEPAFQNARYLVNRIDLAWQEELAQRFDEDRAIWDRLLAPLRSRGVLQAIDGDHEITQGVRARHLPGHTPGHQVVQVSDGGASPSPSGAWCRTGRRVIAAGSLSVEPTGVVLPSTQPRFTVGFVVHGRACPFAVSAIRRRRDRYLRDNGGRGNQHDCWNRQVVQRQQGLRLHPA